MTPYERKDKAIDLWVNIALWIIVIVFMLAAIGCRTADTQKSLAATQDVIYGLKKGWTTYVSKEYDRINKLPATEQIPLRDVLKARNARAIVIADKVDALWWTAWERAKLNKQAPVSAELVTAIAELKLATQP